MQALALAGRAHCSARWPSLLRRAMKANHANDAIRTPAIQKILAAPLLMSVDWLN